jgi:pyruvate dehydrogenase E2 component (dihydrolipoamide acetyltransferase)
MVPVIRDADKKGIYQIAKELAELAAKAKEGKLKPADMQGGCFTISSLGGMGTTYFAPIVNMPEVGILGVSKAQTKPVWDGKAFQPKLMLPLSLSLDHRVVDGAEGAKFLTTVCKYLSDIRELLL